MSTALATSKTVEDEFSIEPSRKKQKLSNDDLNQTKDNNFEFKAFQLDWFLKKLCNFFHTSDVGSFSRVSKRINEIFLPIRDQYLISNKIILQIAAERGKFDIILKYYQQNHNKNNFHQQKTKKNIFDPNSKIPMHYGFPIDGNNLSQLQFLPFWAFHALHPRSIEKLMEFLLNDEQLQPIPKRDPKQNMMISLVEVVLEAAQRERLEIVKTIIDHSRWKESKFELFQIRQIINAMLDLPYSSASLLMKNEKIQNSISTLEHSNLLICGINPFGLEVVMNSLKHANRELLRMNLPLGLVVDANEPRGRSIFPKNRHKISTNGELTTTTTTTTTHNYLRSVSADFREIIQEQSERQQQFEKNKQRNQQQQQLQQQRTHNHIERSISRPPPVRAPPKNPHESPERFAINDQIENEEQRNGGHHHHSTTNSPTQSQWLSNCGLSLSEVHRLEFAKHEMAIAYIENK